MNLQRRIATEFTSSVSIVRPPGAAWFTVCSLGVLGLSAVFLTTATYTRRVAADGVITPLNGSIQVMSPGHGTVSSVAVAEGQRVRKGDVVLTVADDRRKVGGIDFQSYRSVRELLIESQERILRDVGKNRVNMAERDTRALRSKLEIAVRELTTNAKQKLVERDRVEVARTNLQRYRDLSIKGHVAPAAMASVQDELSAREAQLLVLTREAQGIERAKADLEAEIDSKKLSTEIELASQERELASLMHQETIVESQASFAVVAAADGIVTAISVREGSSVGDLPVAQLIPDNSEMIAELFVKSDSVGLVEPGQIVRIRIKAFPYQHYGQQEGTVLDVSESSMLSAATISHPEWAGQPAYRIRVALPKNHAKSPLGLHRLKSGMEVSASISLETRPLIQWILEPLYGIAYRLT